MEELFPGVFRSGNEFYTRSRVPGTAVYGEERVNEDGGEYRCWSPHRSKAAAALTKGLGTFPVERSDAVLYLGASTGTTASHIADVVADGVVHAVEYSPRVIRNLLQVAQQWDNLAPILGDARTPQDYRPLCSRVDVVYQDVTQQDQVAILNRNADMFLKQEGYALLAVKAQSISSTTPPETVFEEVKDGLRDRFEILDGKKLAPFHTDHLFLVLQKPA